MTKQGIKWVNCAFGYLFKKKQIYIVNMLLFFCTWKGQGTLLFTSSNTSYLERVKV